MSARESIAAAPGRDTVQVGRRLVLLAAEPGEEDRERRRLREPALQTAGDLGRGAGIDRHVAAERDEVALLVDVQPHGRRQRSVALAVDGHPREPVAVDVRVVDHLVGLDHVVGRDLADEPDAGNPPPASARPARFRRR